MRPWPCLRQFQGGNTVEEASRVLVDDVHDAIFDLVELIKTFQSKNKLSKLFLSTLFKRRKDELEATVDRAIMRLQVSMDHRFCLVAHVALRPCSWLYSHGVSLPGTERTSVATIWMLRAADVPAIFLTGVTENPCGAARRNCRKTMSCTLLIA